MVETVILSSPDNISVKSASGLSAAFVDSSSSRSCHVGIKWVAFQSALGTCQMLLFCSRILDTIIWREPQHVAQSVTREWGIKPNSD